MLLDLEQAPGAIERRTQVCVIGAGAAGITTARRLLSLGHEVILLESGGVDHEHATAQLNAGQIVGRDYYPLESARLRFFGGTTAIWGGRCAELDPIDLEKRDWVAGSGWPISWDELQRYYREARPIFGLPPEPPREEALRTSGVPLPIFDRDRLRTPLWSFDASFGRFTRDACNDLIADQRCIVVTHATVTAINVSDDGHRVTELVASCRDPAKQLRIMPDAVVLAAGGIENPRLLLASRSVVAAGLGNEHDQVGRYFMEHPHARGGRVVNARSWALLKAFARRHRLNGRDIAALITPAPSIQRREHILNTSLTIVARQPADADQFLGMRLYGGLKHDLAPTKAGRRLWMLTKKAAGWAQRHVDPLRPWLLHKAKRVELALLVRAEQAPNPNSRVRLTSGHDAMGVPRVALDWRLSAIDKRSVTVLVDTLDAELRRLGIGEARRTDWLDDASVDWRTDPLVSSHPIGGYHHIGTTRMSDDPRHGVVDATGRLHHTRNLWVVGSSVFPTSGWANPTLTIAALSLRTADNLHATLTRPIPPRPSTPELATQS